MAGFATVSISTFSIPSLPCSAVISRRCVSGGTTCCCLPSDSCASSARCASHVTSVDRVFPRNGVCLQDRPVSTHTPIRFFIAIFRSSKALPR